MKLVITILFVLTTMVHANDPQSSAIEKLSQLKIKPTIVSLLQYAASGDLKTVKLLVDSGTDINQADEINGATALHNAAALGHTEMLQWLLQNGAKINAKDKQGATPLIWATYHGRNRAVSSLLDSKALVNIVPVNGPTALIATIQAGKIKDVKKLIKYGADTLLPSSDNITPLEVAKLSKRIKIVEYLLSIKEVSE